MKLSKKWIWIIGLSCIGLICLFFLYKWYKFHNAIQYAIAPSTVIAITGNDYESTLKKLHKLPLVGELENDGATEVLSPSDFLKLELAHAPGLKRLFKNKKHILSFKTGSKNQLQSLLAVEGSREAFDSLMREIIEKDYTIARYKAPSGEIIEAYNAEKKKELVLSYIYGVILISSEALYAEETLNNIAAHESLFKKVTLNFSADYIYLKESAIELWVDNITLNHNSEFFKWFESIDEAEFKITEDGTVAATSLFFKDFNTQKIDLRRTPFLLENWLQNIASNYIAFHPLPASSEIGLKEIYRCYTNLQDENISNNTFVVAMSEQDSGTLKTIFSKHAIETFMLLEKFKIYKFGKHPFFKNFCNGVTADLPETFITIISNNAFIVSSSVASLIPLLQKSERIKPDINDPVSGVFVMQIQPQHLLPYFGNIIREKYKEDVMNSSFLQNLDFIQYRLDSIDGSTGRGAVFFNKNSGTGDKNAELLWSKILEQETEKIVVLKSKKAGEHFFLYQDLKNVLHCFSFSSNELWQKFILGRIESKIYPTDLYGNNQNQFFFNTDNQIYAIDNAGKDLSNFPKQINNESGHGMYLFYMGDKYEYFFVDDNMIYGYDAGGASMEDWRPRESPVPIHKELMQYKKRNKNYIIGINRNGEVIIWNRFGKRVERDLDFGMPLATNFSITPAINKNYRPELIAVNNEGEILSLTLDSLQRKMYKIKLAMNTHHFIIQTTDSAFQKIAYQYKDKLLLFDRNSQLTDTVKLAKNYVLQKVFDIDEKQSFLSVSDGHFSRIISSHKRIVADKIEGEIIDIVADELPNQYFVLTFDQLKRVNLYKFSL